MQLMLQTNAASEASGQMEQAQRVRHVERAGHVAQIGKDEATGARDANQTIGASGANS